MRILFLTSGNYLDETDSINALNYAANYLKISACILDDDKISDRFMHFCMERSIPLYTHEHMHDIVSQKKIRQPDVSLAYHYRSIVKKELLDFSINGIINFHPAPLPEHKGIAGCVYAILHNYSQWGVSAHYMEKGIDTGPIIKVRYFGIDGHDCSSIMLQRVCCGHLYALFQEIVNTLASGNIPIGIPQQLSGHYYSRRQLEKDKNLNITDDKETIEHKIKSMWHPPFHGATITLDGERYTLVNQRILDELGRMYSFILDEHKEIFEKLQ